MDTIGARHLAARLRAGVRVGTTIVLDADDPESGLDRGRPRRRATRSRRTASSSSGTGDSGSASTRRRCRTTLSQRPRETRTREQAGPARPAAARERAPRLRVQRPRPRLAGGRTRRRRAGRRACVTGGCVRRGTRGIRCGPARLGLCACGLLGMHGGMLLGLLLRCWSSFLAATALTLTGAFVAALAPPVRAPKSIVITQVGAPPKVPPAVDACTEPMPTSRQSGSSMFSRWGGESSHASDRRVGVDVGRVVEEVLAGRPARIAGRAVEVLQALDERRPVGRVVLEDACLDQLAGVGDGRILERARDDERAKAVGGPRRVEARQDLAVERLQALGRWPALRPRRVPCPPTAPLRASSSPSMRMARFTLRVTSASAGGIRLPRTGEALRP